MRTKNLFGMLALLGLSGWMFAACSDDSAGTNNTNKVCNHNGQCDAGENTANCPDDCPKVQCSLTDGDNYNYIMNKIQIPLNGTEAKTIGVDLDGDGTIDNKLGQIMALVPKADDGTTVNDALQTSIDNGTIILLGRLIMNQWPSDDVMAAQIFPGDTTSGDATADDLSGTGCALVSSTADQSLKLCGMVANNSLRVGPDSIQIALSLSGVNMTISLDQAQAEGTVHEDSWSDVQVGGGITKENLNNELIPALVSWLNDATKKDPTGSVGKFVLDSLDANCSTSAEGCEDVTNGSGDCKAWDPQNPVGDPLTDKEIKCSSLFAAALKPDVDIDGDGTKDLLSLGIKVSAVKVTIGSGTCQ